MPRPEAAIATKERPTRLPASASVRGRNRTLVPVLTLILPAVGGEPASMTLVRGVGNCATEPGATCRCAVNDAPDLTERTLKGPVQPLGIHRAWLPAPWPQRRLCAGSVLTPRARALQGPLASQVRRLRRTGEGSIPGVQLPTPRARVMLACQTAFHVFTLHASRHGSISAFTVR